MSTTPGAVDGWLRPAPYDGGPASLAEHVTAISAATADGAPLWLGPGEPPSALPAELADTVLVVPTSGSTGTAKAVTHTAATLRASQDATASLFAADGTAPGTGGHGFWLPLLPPTHIAGVQVIARARRTAEVLDLAAPALPSVLPDLRGRFDADLFVPLAEQALSEAEQWGLPAFTSLVPTQLARLIGTTGVQTRARALLRRFAAILVGGAATAPELLAAARARRLPVRTTYGSSETAGGCVYDGVALPDVALSLRDAADGEGRLLVGTPSLTPGYLTAAGAASTEGLDTRGGRRVLVTSDLARLDAEGRLTVLGRADDMVVSGGRKILPQDVERAVAASPLLQGTVTDCLAVGVPDPEWGERLEVLVTLAPGADPAEVPALLRSALRLGALPAHAVPKRVHVVAELPLRGIGKPDRAAAREFARSRDGSDPAG